MLLSWGHTKEWSTAAKDTQQEPGHPSSSLQTGLVTWKEKFYKDGREDSRSCSHQGKAKPKG